jgi:hypothetical protein
MKNRALLSTTACCAMFSACWSAQGSKEEVDERVYPIVEAASEQVTGIKKTVPIVRPVDTLRQRLIDSPTPVRLSLVEALDVAAENSRDFQRQKEQLYLAALDLTRAMRQFEVVYSGDVSSGIDGQGRDTSSDVDVGAGLGASTQTESGGRIVADFATTFLRSVLSGGDFDGSSILSLSITQPLMRGYGRRIAREPLTQAERNVIYQMRSFERFRATFATQVVSDYYGVVQQAQNLKNVEANYCAPKRSSTHRARRSAISAANGRANCPRATTASARRTSSRRRSTGSRSRWACQ